MNDKQGSMPNVSGGYETLQIILIVVIGILIAFFIFSTYAIEYVNNNQVKQLFNWDKKWDHYHITTTEHHFPCVNLIFEILK